MSNERIVIGNKINLITWDSLLYHTSCSKLRFKRHFAILFSFLKYLCDLWTTWLLHSISNYSKICFGVSSSSYKSISLQMHIHLRMTWCHSLQMNHTPSTFYREIRTWWRKCNWSLPKMRSEVSRAEVTGEDAVPGKCDGTSQFVITMSGGLWTEQ